MQVLLAYSIFNILTYIRNVLKLFLKLIFMCVSVFSTCVTCMPGTSRGPKRASVPTPPTQNWSYSVNYQVGVGNGIMPSARTSTLNHRAFLLVPTSETLCPSISNWLWWHIPINSYNFSLWKIEVGHQDSRSASDTQQVWCQSGLHEIFKNPKQKT